VARGEWQRREDQRRHQAEEAARVARVRLQVARNLERNGEFNAALRSYAKIARDAPDSDAGQRAAARIAEVRRRRELLEGQFYPQSPMFDAQ
jgi:hypothetical protein